MKLLKEIGIVIIFFAVGVLLAFLGCVILLYSQEVVFKTPLSSEIALVFSCVGFLLLVRKSGSKRRNSVLLPIFFGMTAWTLIMGFRVYVLMHEQAIFSDHTKYFKKIESEFQVKNDLYIPLFTTIFDTAEAQNVRQEIDKQYDSELTYHEYQNERYREPSYFIRIKNGKLQKLFQSGELKTEAINTRGEKMVERMLIGELEPIVSPQYTCCGGDDFIYNIPFLRYTLPIRRYLRDFPSEAEIILLVKDKDNKILGAKVYLYGD